MCAIQICSTVNSWMILRMSNVLPNPLDQAFITHWKAQNFVTWNEPDVREEFIAPLLKTLGYAKGTVNNILREESLHLSQSFHRIGRKRIEIDYVPTVRLKKFWIIEAKPGSPKQIEYEDLLQAHLYAVHPEIRAGLIVVTNGWEIRVFDSDYCDAWDEPLLICTQQNCELEFLKLREILGARELLTSVRARVLGQIEKSLEVEFDERVVTNLQQEFSRIVRKAQTIVQKNARELSRQGFLERQNAANDERKKASFGEILAMMNNPLDLTPPLSIEVSDRIINAAPDEQAKMIDQLAMQYRGRPHSAFRVHCASIFARLVVMGINPPGTFYVKNVREGLEDVVSQ